MKRWWWERWDDRMETLVVANNASGSKLGNPKEKLPRSQHINACGPSWSVDSASFKYWCKNIDVKSYYVLQRCDFPSTMITSNMASLSLGKVLLPEAAMMSRTLAGATRRQSSSSETFLEEASPIATSKVSFTSTKMKCEVWTHFSTFCSSCHLWCSPQRQRFLHSRSFLDQAPPGSSCKALLWTLHFLRWRRHLFDVLLVQLQKFNWHMLWKDLIFRI